MNIRYVLSNAFSQDYTTKMKTKGLRGEYEWGQSKKSLNQKENVREILLVDHTQLWIPQQVAHTVKSKV